MIHNELYKTHIIFIIRLAMIRWFEFPSKGQQPAPIWLSFPLLSLIERNKWWPNFPALAAHQIRSRNRAGLESSGLKVRFDSKLGLDRIRDPIRFVGGETMTRRDPLKRIVTLHIRICVPLRGIAPTIGPCESGRHESNCYLLRLAALSMLS